MPLVAGTAPGNNPGSRSCFPRRRHRFLEMPGYLAGYLPGLQSCSTAERTSTGTDRGAPKAEGVQCRAVMYLGMCGIARSR